MTRTLLAAAAFLAAGTLMNSAAQACLSCEYVPEVVRDHATSPDAYGRGQVNATHGSYVGYSSKKRFVAKSEDAPRPKKVAKIDRSEKSEKPAKVAKVSKPEKAEPVKVAKASKSEKAEPVKVVAKAEPAAKQEEPKAAESESSSITVASVAATETTAPAPAPVKETAAKPTDCKKFFASVGMTLTVPCE